jgi:hypothetical protein
MPQAFSIELHHDVISVARKSDASLAQRAARDDGLNQVDSEKESVKLREVMGRAVADLFRMLTQNDLPIRWTLRGFWYASIAGNCYTNQFHHGLVTSYSANFSMGASIPLSRRCASVIRVGAPVSGSPPLAVFGNAITSRMESEFVKSAQTRSRPSAIPPCGGGP